MFRSIKMKIQQMLDFRNSTSICKQSKGERIDSNLEQSLKKTNENKSEEKNDECSTPYRHILVGNSSDHFDSIETVSRQITPSNFLVPNNMSSMNKFTSIDSVSSKISSNLNKQFLPQELKTILTKNDSKSRLVWDQNFDSSSQISLDEIGQPIFQDFKDFLVDQIGKEDQIIETPTQEKKDTKIPKESVKREIAILIKQERLQTYEKEKKKELKGKSKFSCIICQEHSCSSDSFYLACTHRIHKLCAEISRWRPKMKCLLCEGKNVKNSFFRVKHNEIVRKANKNLNQKVLFE